MSAWPYHLVFDVGDNVHICGNNYHLVVKMDFRGRGLVLVRHVVTHKEYDRLIERGAL